MITEDTVSSDEIEIHAPVELVWQVLVDFANYGAWNKFCPVCEAELVIGSPVKMQVDLGFGLQEQKCRYSYRSFSTKNARNSSAALNGMAIHIPLMPNTDSRVT